MIKNKLEHLYIHIPFCKSICTYCDFVRQIPKCNQEIDTYLNLICKQIKDECKGLKFKTIYIGGGTPNSLNNSQLNKLLSQLKPLLKNKYEFTIECNPEFINQNQINVFKLNKINRISLGVQTTNNKINKLFNRKHTLNDVVHAIDLLQKNKLNNISLDFIYGFKLIANHDIENAIKLIKSKKIKHVSFYSLELKKGSILTQQKYQLNDELIDHQFAYIINQLKKYGYQRYEVSNWAINSKYYSQHNLCYWNTKQWKAIGLGGYGLESMNYYHYEGNINKMIKIDSKYSLKDLYQHILIMGLRLVKSLNLKIKQNLDAYNFFKNKIDPQLISIKNNYLKAKNINLLDDILINII